MPNSTSQNNIYDELFQSINALFFVDETIKRDKVALSSCAEFLTQREPEIDKFAKSAGEVSAYLDSYDFSHGIHLDAIIQKIEALHPLRLQLVKMGEEAKKLSVYPDRYGSKKAIETCKKLAEVCMQKMSLDEISKVAQLVEANTQKLIQLQKLLATDDALLQQIKAEIDAHQSLLSKFQAYYTELLQYVAEFPHESLNDFEEVKKRIQVAQRLDETRNKVQSYISAIQDFCDRYNKGAVVSKFMNILHQMATSMRYVDVGLMETQLNELQKKAIEVVQAFEKEHCDLLSLQSSLKSCQAGLWKEDNEKLLKIVNGLLTQPTARIDFNISQIKTSFMDAQSKRSNDIKSTTLLYPWLTTQTRYKTRHDALATGYITSKEYFSAVNEMRRERLLRIILLCIPIIGWIILYLKSR